MKRSVVIIGGGPAAMMLAATLDQQKFDISIFEKNKALGRKFLVAGQGGFNLTHSETIEPFINRYSPLEFIEPLIRSFSNTDLRGWLNDAGIPTLVGSSNRVFPIDGIKPVQVLDAILDKLKKNNVQLFTEHSWLGWDKNEQLVFKSNEKQIILKPDITVFALGGASWKETGSDGLWTEYFRGKGIDLIPFQPSNCAFQVDWPKALLASCEGQPLKNIAVSCSGKEKKGELVITSFGIEGGAVYALSPQIRSELNSKQSATVYLDLKPSLNETEIKQQLKNRPLKIALGKFLLDTIKLSKTQLALLKSLTSKDDFTRSETLASLIKKLPLTITGMAPVDEAISTVGGIPLNEIDANFQLKKLKNNYVIGEMLDWDAPTGGYLLQACFSMGNVLGKHLNHLTSFETL